MRRLYFEFDTNISFSQSVSEHAFLLRCIPKSNPSQQLSRFTVEIKPQEGPLTFSSDCFGNPVCSGRVTLPHSSFSYSCRGMVYRNDSRKSPEKPMECYRYPSALTAVTPELTEFLSEVPEQPTARETAEAICEAVHSHFSYTPGITTTSTAAGDAFLLGQGVCQDYAHVFLALARQRGLYARYVCGLPEGDGYSHAWVEVWDDDCWHGYDPTRMVPVDEGYIQLSVGRDFMDCPVERGQMLGICTQTQSSFMRVYQK